MTMTDEESTAFWRGFDLAQPPGREELDAIDRAEEFAPSDDGQLRLAVSKEVGAAFVVELDRLPGGLAAAAWLGFLRGLASKSGGAPVHVHQLGRA